MLFTAGVATDVTAAVTAAVTTAFTTATVLLLNTVTAREVGSLRREEQCPQIMPAMLCPVPQVDKCSSWFDCNFGDDCCASICGLRCYNPETGYYVLPKSICPKINTLIFCLWFNERCNSEKPCGENEECCSDNCGTFCYSAPAE
ncbi:WAP-type 'four-disulfide core' domain [Trinorchestia longiramus]|nr:WAP-type 'four-disulfide core' domain [Trinorchestia longiramus]